MTSETKTARPIFQIAKEIREKWKNVNYAARPYLDAMGSIAHVSENYGMDTGRSVVLYFLSNAASWRGEDARRIKAELKEALAS